VYLYSFNIFYVCAFVVLDGYGNMELVLYKIYTVQQARSHSWMAFVVGLLRVCLCETDTPELFVRVGPSRRTSVVLSLFLLSTDKSKSFDVLVVFVGKQLCGSFPR